MPVMTWTLRQSTDMRGRALCPLSFEYSCGSSRVALLSLRLNSAAIRATAARVRVAGSTRPNRVSFGVTRAVGRDKEWLQFCSLQVLFNTPIVWSERTSASWLPWPMRTAGFGRRLATLSLLGSVASLNLDQLGAVKLRRVVVGDGDSLARLADEPAVAAGSR